VAIHLFENIGHMPHLEDRAAIARLLRELVRAASGA
jgi:pimeloyl-ACP methyl ester carboxylesterase